MSTFKRKRTWWTQVFVDGRRVRESTGIRSDGADPPKDVVRIHKQREGRAASGLPMLPRADKIRYDELAKDLRQDYTVSGSRDLEEAGYRLQHLDRAFKRWRAVAITSSAITEYALKRQHEKAANGTINRELATLSRMLKLAYENGKLLRPPVIKRLKEAPAREGFFEDAQFEEVRRHLPADLQVAVTIAFTFGWRTQSEILTLERRHVDLAAGTLRLDAGMAKNDEGRVVYLTAELKTMLAAQFERVRGLERRLGRVISAVFPHMGKGPRAGLPRRDFRKRWLTACRKAGVPGRLRHDFRRTAARNMLAAGVTEGKAMKVTGHKTRSMFDRYAIVSLEDLKDVARRLEKGTSGR